MTNQVRIEDIKKIKASIDTILTKIKTFQIIDSEVVPEGIKPIARSVSWLVEQVIVQNLRANKSELNLEYVNDPPNNVSQYDCILKYRDDPKEYHVNLKTSLVSTTSSGRFDISKGPKLLNWYEENPNLILIIATIKVDIRGCKLYLADSVVFNVAWIDLIYYNRANHNLQSSADGSPRMRSNQEFVRLLKEKVHGAGHTDHY
jgi:hypothetical protein